MIRRFLRTGCSMGIIAGTIFAAVGWRPSRAAEPKTDADEAKNAAVPDRQKEGHFEGEIKVTVRLNYLVYLPQGYEGGDEHWPLLLFLHGSGERGRDIEKVAIHGPPKLIAEGKQFPFIVVSPQAARRSWDPWALNALLDDLMRKYRVDKDRVYLTGLSMGGYGTWELAAAHPDRFAAIAPVCGGGDPSEAERLKNMPVWVFHGAEDKDVPVKKSEEMVEALKDAGSKSVKFTVYPNVGHDSWTETYNDPELYDWLLHQRLSERGK